MRLVITSLLAVALTTCSGSGGGNGRVERRDASQPEELTGSLTVAGSTSVQPLVEVLAEAFRQKNPRVRIHVQGGGSTSGIRAVLSGVAHIGASSRALAPEEEGLSSFLVARDAIAVVVHPSNPITSLSLDQIRKIFAAEVKKWNEVGGRGGPIVLVTREAGSGTRGVFEEAMAGRRVWPGAIVQNTMGAVRATVAGDPRAIGYISLPGIDRTVKAVGIDGVSPTLKAVQSGRYPVVREFLLVTRGRPAGLAGAFVEFALSPEGQAVVVSEGLVPVRSPGVRLQQGRR